MSRPKIKSAAYRLFHFRYPVRLPPIFMYGENYIDKVGYPISGDSKLDHERLYTPDVIRQSPAGLAMLHAQGAPIDFVDPKDTVVVYEDIQEHLRDWEAMVVAGCHVDDVPPIEDFRMLEDVAVAIHSIAKYFQPREVSRNLVKERIHAMNMRRSSVNSYITAKQKEAKAHEKPYVSIVDRIERRLQEG